MARLRPAARNIPSYVWIQNLAGDVQPRYLTGGHLGAAYSPLRVGTDLDNPSAPTFRMTAFDTPRDVPVQRLLERCRLLSTLDRPAGMLPQTNTDTAFRRFQERAVDIVTGPEARRAFDLDREPAVVRDRYGRHPLGQNLLMARRLIEAGVRLVGVHAWTGVAPGAKLVTVNIWDGHGGGDFIRQTLGTGAYGLGFRLPPPG